MFKKLSISFVLLSIAACSTPTKQEIDFAKLKPEERAYTGAVQVNLNGKTNADLTCDLFLNSDIAPTIRLAADGVYQFKSIKKKLAFTRISCLHQVGKEKQWIHHTLELERVKQPESNSEFHNLGLIEIKWLVDDKELNPASPGFGSEDKMRNIGKLEVKKTEAKPVSPQI